MPKGRPEVSFEATFTITEGSTVYPMRLRLVKSSLVIEDHDGNRVTIDKRKGKILVKRKGNVEWHREKRAEPF